MPAKALVAGIDLHLQALIAPPLARSPRSLHWNVVTILLATAEPTGAGP